MENIKAVTSISITVSTTNTMNSAKMKESSIVNSNSNIGLIAQLTLHLVSVECRLCIMTLIVEILSRILISSISMEAINLEKTVDVSEHKSIEKIS